MYEICLLELKAALSGNVQTYGYRGVNRGLCGLKLDQKMSPCPIPKKNQTSSQWTCNPSQDHSIHDLLQCPLKLNRTSEPWNPLIHKQKSYMAVTKNNKMKDVPNVSLVCFRVSQNCPSFRGCLWPPLSSSRVCFCVLQSRWSCTSKKGVLL